MANLEPILHVDVNQMDSHNLATVFLPVLVRSADIQQDALICTMPRKISNIDKGTKEAALRQRPETSSLGSIIKLCIDRFDDIFPGYNGTERQTAEIAGRPESSTMTPASSRSTSTASKSSMVRSTLVGSLKKECSLMLIQYA